MPPFCLFLWCIVISGVTSLCSCQTSGQSEGGGSLYKRHIHITGEVHRCNTPKNWEKTKTDGCLASGDRGNGRALVKHTHKNSISDQIRLFRSVFSLLFENLWS